MPSLSSRTHRGSVSRPSAATEQRNFVPSVVVTTKGSTNLSDRLRRCIKARWEGNCSFDRELLGLRGAPIEQHAQRVFAGRPPVRVLDVKCRERITPWRDCFRTL